jgi:hypothetical protein
MKRPQKYATTEEVQAAIDRAKRVLAEYTPKANAPPQLDPTVQKIRELLRLRHARRIDEAQRASQERSARQERTDKAVKEFEKWIPGMESWLM